MMTVGGYRAWTYVPTCKDDLRRTKVRGGIANVTAKKSWQPRGGEFTFAIETPMPMASDALVTVCFGRKQSEESGNPKEQTESRPKW
jgi:hypothetical protein